MMRQLETLQGATEVSGPGLAQLNEDECFVGANAAFLSMLGRCEAELLGQHWSCSVHPEDHARTRLAYAEARVGGRGYTEIRAVRADSAILHQTLAITGVKDSAGLLTGFHCIRHDISGTGQVQAALVVGVESAINGSLLVNSAGEIRATNRAVENLVGYEQGELIGSPVQRLLPPYGDADRGREVRKAVEGQDVFGVRKDGRDIPVQVYCNRIGTGAEELTLCAVVDISQRVGHEHQLELSKEAAEAANRAKSDFLARMSHEIRTPMNLIMGMNALLLESPLNQQQRQHVEISYRNLRRLLRLINGILDLSKVEAGGLTLERTAFDLYEVLGECEATMASAITRKGLQFKMVIHPDTSRFWIGDAERLQQILMNLIGNSVKFTSQGKIELAVRRERSPLGEEGVRFEVTDTGCGVPADKAEMIFEPFQQAEGGIGRAFEGSGLGLAIARTLVSLMSGRIWMEPRPEGGSKFVFTAFFTAVEGNAAPLKTAALSQSHSAGTLQPGTKVLVVEDNQENLILLQAYLQNLFLSLEYASNGLEAVEKCRREDYDLVLMDIQMPIMDGYTATREIRAWEKGKGLPPVPIVALTAHALSGARNQSLEAGCVEHLTKPVDRKDLVEVITRFSKRSAAPVKALEEPLAEGIEALRPAYLAKRKLDLEALREALGVSDFAKIQSMAHNCKGTGRGYGFPEISIAGAALENAAKAQDPAAVEISLQQFERSIGAVVPVGVSAG